MLGNAVRVRVSVSWRVGMSVSGKNLDPTSVRMAKRTVMPALSTPAM